VGTGVATGRISEGRRDFSVLHSVQVSRCSAVGIATGCGLDDRGSEFESRGSKKFSLLHIVQIGSEVHPTSYPMGTGVSFLGDKAVGA
jgi:hypothetical protein